VFTRLCLIFLVRWPFIYFSRKKNNNETFHWSRQKEKANGYGPLHFTLLLFRIFPVAVVRIIAFPVSFCYFIFSKKARSESKRFSGNYSAFTNSRKKFSVIKHILSFSLTLIDKMDAWSGKENSCAVSYQDDDITDLAQNLEASRGAFLICSHLGNAEMLRAKAELKKTCVTRGLPLVSIVDFSVTPQFNRMINELNPDATAQVISAAEIWPGTFMELSAVLEKGGLVVIAGDRTSASAAENPLLLSKRCVALPFLGFPALFPEGPFLLASLLDAPVYYMFALREKDISIKPRYVMHVYKSGVSFAKTRSERKNNAGAMVKEFAGKLEELCVKYPYQWYNFYDFWRRQ
jgi:predicted LPLAT superfamily acyltransferase